MNTQINTTNQRTRVIAGVLMAMSIIFGLVMLVALISVWILRSSVNERITNGLNAAENIVQQLDSGLVRVNDRLVAVQSRVTAVEDRINQAGTTAAEANLLRTAVELIVGEELPPIIGELRETVSGIVELVNGLESTVSALNSIPGINITIPGSQTYREVRDRVTNLATTVTDFRDAVQQRRTAAVGELTTVVTSHTRRINDAVESVRAPLEQAQSRTSAALEQIVRVREELPQTITLIALGLSLLLLWAIISQVIVFALGYSWWTGRDLLARWRPAPAIQQSELPPLSTVETAETSEDETKATD